MKHRYRIRYVGDDSRTHHMTVWAESAHHAKLEAKRRGAEFVTRIKSASLGWVWILLALIVSLAIQAVVGK